MHPDNTVYLDNNASTPLDPRVLDAMLDALGTVGNPSSTHAAGVAARAAVERARRQVAGLFGADPRGVVFTAGATEANNWVLKGLAAGARKRRIVSCATEHLSVLVPLEGLRRQGFDVRVVPVGSDGVPDLAALEAAVDDETLVVSVMGVNNETGVRAPLAEITRFAHARGALVHTDATQLMAWGGLDLAAVPADLVSLSAHKFHGPQGVGALYVGPAARSALRPLVEGGGQEDGLRSGTLNKPGIVGLGIAAELAATDGAAAAPAVAARRDRLHELIAGSAADVVVNGATAPRAPGTLSVALPRVDPAALAALVPHVHMSAGSACHSAAAEPSHVLVAMGLDAGLARATVRLSLSRFTTDADVERAGADLRAAIDAIVGR